MCMLISESYLHMWVESGESSKKRKNKLIVINEPFSCYTHETKDILD